MSDAVLYIVIMADGQLMSGHFDLTRATEKAQHINGAVAAVPIIADFRAGKTDQRVEVAEADETRIYHDAGTATQIPDDVPVIEWRG